VHPSLLHHDLTRDAATRDPARPRAIKRDTHAGHTHAATYLALCAPHYDARCAAR